MPTLAELEQAANQAQKTMEQAWAEYVFECPVENWQDLIQAAVDAGLDLNKLRRLAGISDHVFSRWLNGLNAPLMSIRGNIRDQIVFLLIRDP